MLAREKAAVLNGVIEDLWLELQAWRAEWARRGCDADTADAMAMMVAAGLLWKTLHDPSDLDVMCAVIKEKIEQEGLPQ